MIKYVKKSPGIWGLFATGPAIWGGASMMAAGGLFELTGGSLAYALALMGVGVVSISCGVVGCINVKHEIDAETDVQQRMEDLEANYEALREELEQLNAHRLQVGDSNSDVSDDDVAIDNELSHASRLSQSVSASSYGGAMFSENNSATKLENIPMQPFSSAKVSSYGAV